MAGRTVLFVGALLLSGTAGAREASSRDLGGPSYLGEGSQPSDEARPPSGAPAPSAPATEGKRGDGAPAAPRPWGLEPSIGLVWESFDQAFGSATSSQGLTFPSGKFSGSGIGIRGTMNGLGLALYKTSGKFSDASGTSPTFDLTSCAFTYTGGSKVLWSRPGSGVKLGVLWPEVLMKLSWGSQDQVDILNYTVGVSVVGLRSSFADRFFVELHLLQLAYEMQKTTFPIGAGATDSVLATKFNVAASPGLRAGVTF